MFFGSGWRLSGWRGKVGVEWTGERVCTFVAFFRPPPFPLLCHDSPKHSYRVYIRKKKRTKKKKKGKKKKERKCEVRIACGYIPKYMVGT